MTTTIVDDLFAALNLTGLESNQKTALLVGVAVTLGFLAYRMVKRVAAKF